MMLSYMRKLEEEGNNLLGHMGPVKRALNNCSGKDTGALTKNEMCNLLGCIYSFKRPCFCKHYLLVFKHTALLIFARIFHPTNGPECPLTFLMPHGNQPQNCPRRDGFPLSYIKETSMDDWS